MFPTSFRSIHRLRHTMTQQKTRAVAPWQWLISLTQTQWVARTSATSWGLVFAESYLQTTWWFVKSLQQQPSTSLHSAQKPTPASATRTGNKKIALVQLCASVTQRYLVQHSFTSWTHARTVAAHLTHASRTVASKRWLDANIFHHPLSLKTIGRVKAATQNNGPVCRSCQVPSEA